MLVKIYLGIGSLVCLGFAVAAIAGWKGPDLSMEGSQQGVYGGGRGAGVGYSTWHGGK